MEVCKMEDMISRVGTPAILAQKLGVANITVYMWRREKLFPSPPRQEHRQVQRCPDRAVTN